MLVPACVEDYRILARRRLPRQFFDLIDGGAYEEITLRENHSDIQKLRFRQRVMRDVSKLDTGVTVLGQRLKQPLILAPVGFCGLFAGRGEVLAARAAEKAGVPFCLSTVSICSLDEVRQATTEPFWFQLYMMRDRGFVRDLLQKAQDVGCSALVFTVDLAVLGARYRDVRNGMAANAPLKAKLATAWQIMRHPRWIKNVAIGGTPLIFGNIAHAVPDARNLGQFKNWVDEQFDPSVTWRDIEWVRDNWTGPIIIKGVLDSEDARAAAEIGAQAIIISNHGGRQLDSAPSTISVLPRIVDAVGDRLEVLMDGGIRSGQDVVKAMACGAKACSIGKAWVYALAAEGENGVTDVLKIMKREMEITMALLGISNAEQIDRSVIESGD
jgi:L-lactate dehydrogenase (cytochrome)